MSTKTATPKKTRKAASTWIIARYPDAPILSYGPKDLDKANSDFNQIMDDPKIKGLILKDLRTGQIIRHYAGGRELSKSNPTPTTPLLRASKPEPTIRKVFVHPNWGIPGRNTNF